MADGMRIALIGVVASLLGTLIGGGVTYAVTQSQDTDSRDRR
jgi:ABC-type lipoprotein release transport system permease subunit